MSNLADRLRAELDALNARREEILAQSAPLREERDRIVNEARERELALNAQIKAIEKDMPEIDTNRALLARALGGRRMSDATNVK